MYVWRWLLVSVISLDVQQLLIFFEINIRVLEAMHKIVNK